MALAFRCRAALELLDNGLRQIHISKIHSSLTHEEFVQRMADLVAVGSVRGISDIRNESTGPNVCIIVQLKPDADAEAVYEQLFS